MLAAFKLGAVPINVNYRYVEEELRYLLDDADARAVVFHAEFAPKLAAIAARAARAADVHRGRRRFRTRWRRGRARPGRSRTKPRSRARAPSATSPTRPPTRSTSCTPAAPRACRKASCGATRMRSSARWVARAAVARRSTRRRRSPSAACNPAPGACPPARSCTAPRTGWRSAPCSRGGSVVIPTQRHLDAGRAVGAHRGASRRTSSCSSATRSRARSSRCSTLPPVRTWTSRRSASCSRAGRSSRPR